MSRGSRLSKQDVEDLLQRVMEGVSYRDIAEELGISSSTVFYWVKKSEIGTPWQGVNKKELADMVREYKEENEELKKVLNEARAVLKGGDK